MKLSRSWLFGRSRWRLSSWSILTWGMPSLVSPCLIVGCEKSKEHDAALSISNWRKTYGYLWVRIVGTLPRIYHPTLLLLPRIASFVVLLLKQLNLFELFCLQQISMTMFHNMALFYHFIHFAIWSSIKLFLSAASGSDKGRKVAGARWMVGIGNRNTHWKRWVLRFFSCHCSIILFFIHDLILFCWRTHQHGADVTESKNDGGRMHELHGEWARWRENVLEGLRY